MCGFIDDILPVVGAVAGSFIPGLGTAAGAALGGALGGGVSNYAQTHNWGSALEGAAIGGVGGYFSGGSLNNLFTNLGTMAAGTGTDAAFDTSLMAGTAPTDFGLTTPAGFTGADLGVGQGSSAIGKGLAEGGSLSGLTAPQAAQMGGGMAISGLSGTAGSLGQMSGDTSNQASSALSGSTGGLNDAMNSSTGGFGTGLTSGTSTEGLSASPVSSMSGLNTGSSMGMVSPSAVTPSTSLESGLGGVSPATGSGSASGLNLGDGGYSLEGGQAAGQPGAQAAAMGGYGAPESTGLQATQGTPNIGAMGSDSGGGFGTGLTSGGHIGLTAPNGALGAAKMGGGFGDFLQQNGQGLMNLFKAGYGAYQQHQRQNALNSYMNQINGMFSPNSPYAQQMAQTLGRQDAAAGRNSQYGTRAVQLAAALTQARAQALGNSNYAQAAMATPGANILNSLFSNFATPQGMQQLSNLGSAGFNGLASLFGG